MPVCRNGWRPRDWIALLETDKLVNNRLIISTAKLPTIALRFDVYFGFSTYNNDTYRFAYTYLGGASISMVGWPTSFEISRRA